MFRIFVFLLSLQLSSAIHAGLLQQHQRLAGFDSYEEAAQVETDTLHAVVPVNVEPVEALLITSTVDEVLEPAQVQPAAVSVIEPVITPVVPLLLNTPASVEVLEPVLEQLSTQEPEPELELVLESEPEIESVVEPTPEKPKIVFIKGSVAAPKVSESPVVIEPEPEPEPQVVLSPAPSIETIKAAPVTEDMASESIALEPLSTASTTAVTPLQVDLERLQAPFANPSALITQYDEGVGATGTIEDMIRKALDWHPSLRQARSQILASQEGIDAAKAPYYPQISSGFNTGYRDSTGRDDESFNVSASQLLYDFGKTSSGVKMANHDFNLEQARLLLSIDQLIEQTASASLEIMRSQEKEQIAKKQMEALSELWEVAKDRAQMGASAESDSIQALSRKEAAVALLWQLQAQADIWQKQLQSLTGERGQIQLLTAFPDQLGLQCQNHQLLLDQVPSMRIVEEERGSALAQLDLSDANLYPTISVDAGYDQYLRSREGFVNGRLENRSSDFSVMLNMSMSLFEGGGKVARKNAARYALQAVDAQKESTVLEVTRGFEEAQQKQFLLSNRLRVLLERIGSIERTQELYKDQYMALGTRSLLDLLNTEQEIYQAKSDYIDNKYEMYKAQIACLFYGAELRHAFDISTTERVGG